MITLDDALDQVGGNGKYQYRLFITIALQFLAQGFLLISPTYLYITPQLQCTNETTGATVQCDGTQHQCDTQTVSFAPGYEHENVVTQFDLICGDAIYTSIASSSMFFGSMLGCLLFSYFGDHIGRRKTLLYSWGITTIGIIGITVSFDKVWFIVFTIIAGFGVNGAFNVCFVILNEACNSSFRQRASIALLIVFAGTEIFCAIIYYLVSNWRTVYIIFAMIPAIVGMMLCFTIYETPKFFVCNNQIEEAFAALNKIAQVNGREPLDKKLQLVLTLPQDSPTHARSNEKGTVQSMGHSYIDLQMQYGYQHLFIYKSLRNSTIGFMGMLFALQFIYYGGQYGLNSFSNGNAVYLIGGCVGIAELGSYILTQFTVEKMPRRMSIIVTSMMAILFCACFLAFGVHDSSVSIPDDCDGCSKLILTIVLACLIRVSVSFGFAIEPLYANEVYPTVVRTIGSGFVFSFGLIGSFTAPYTFALAKHYDFNPYFILTLIALIGPLSTFLVRETQGLVLEDEIKEVVRQTKDM